MKKFAIFIILLIFTAGCDAQTTEELIAQNSSLDTNKVIIPQPNHPQVNKLVTRILSRYHYKITKINDSLSSLILDKYLNSLDYNKMYFLKSDINGFEKYRYEIDDFLYDGNLQAAYEIYNLYKKRLNERIKFALERLQKGFDFTIDESFKPNRKDEEWASNADELNDVWRKRLKSDALNLKLTGKNQDEILKILRQRYEQFQKTILQYNSEDVFQLYLNSFTEIIDPHSNYFSPITSENFTIQMSQSLEGIGASLRNINDYTTVMRVIDGGPAAESGLLQEEDRIVGVAQGDTGEMVDVIGWRIDDVVQLIRGDKGTVVRLAILRANDGPDVPPDTIRLTRDKVKLEEQAPKKKVFSLNEDGKNFKIGVIEVSSFYVDFEGKRNGEKDYKSTTSDVKKIIDELKSENVDGIIVDLRGNGGGSLQEAIELTGLFIDDGPVVQVKNSNGSIDIGEDPDPSIAYSGPLGVMVDRFSASASEIFSGAIQDYGRGLIIGEQTYGKGTVQNLIDLNRFLPASGSELGQIKLTVAKYYRITGSSTQHLGVIPDIQYPTAYPAEEFGESSEPSALPWDMIKGTEFQPYDNLAAIIPLLIEKHNKRIAKSPELQNLLEDIKDLIAARNKNVFSLNEETRKKEREEADKRRNKRDETNQANSEIELKEKDEIPLQTLKIDDPLLAEGGFILSDMILFSKVKDTRTDAVRE